MKKEFSFYEFAGVLVPGSTLILAMAINKEALLETFLSKDFGAGQLGLFVVASYIFGHLVQGIGNLLEKALWSFRGMPSTWIRREKVPFLTEGQLKCVRDILPTLLGHDPGDLTNLNDSNLRNITSQLYSTLEREGRVARIDIFNANYGLFRGIAAALLVVLGFTILENGICSQSTLIICGLFILALLRMRRFGIYYASEIYKQILT